MFSGQIVNNWLVVRIRDSFFAFGYLLPATLPLMYILGRGVYNFFGIVYLVWALGSLPRSWPSTDRRLKFLFLFLFLSFLLGVSNAVNPERAFVSWCIYVANASVFFFTLSAFQKGEGRMEKFMRSLAYSSLLVPVALFVKSGLMTGHWGDLIAKRSWQETSLPFLSTFLLWFILSKKVYWRYFVCSLVVGIAAFYVVDSEGRSALVALIAALSVFCLAVMRIKFRYLWAVLMTVCIILASPIADGVLIRTWPKKHADVVTMIDLVSSKRTVFWRQAFEYPPKNNFVGVGMGNVRYYPDVIGLVDRKGVKKPTAKHLHNFVLDLWYETGLFGLLSFLLLNCWILWPVRRIYLSAGLTEKMMIGTVVSAMVAIYVAGLFSIGYTSPHFKMYLFMLFACLVYMSSSEGCDAGC